MTADDSRAEQGAARPDSVDDVVTEMRAILPRSDLSSLQLVSRMLRVVRVFEQRREVLLKKYDLEPWSFDMLAAIRRSERQRLQPGELLAATLVTSGTMTTRLNSLEKRGLIARSRDGRDGRKVQVRVTPTGRRRIDAAFEDVLQCQRDLIADLDPGQRETLEDLLRRILASNDTNTAIH